jgi:hypothetical protein
MLQFGVSVKRIFAQTRISAQQFADYASDAVSPKAGYFRATEVCCLCGFRALIICFCMRDDFVRRARAAAATKRMRDCRSGPPRRPPTSSAPIRDPAVGCSATGLHRPRWPGIRANGSTLWRSSDTARAGARITERLEPRGVSSHRQGREHDEQRRFRHKAALLPVCRASRSRREYLWPNRRAIDVGAFSASQISLAETLRQSSPGNLAPYRLQHG